MITRVQQNRKLYVKARRQAVLAGFLCAAACCALLFFALFQGVYAGDDAMAPAILPGETLLAFRWFLYVSQAQRGDILIYGRGDAARALRVVGLPGERVSVWEGRVYIDGLLLEEDYAQGLLPDQPERAVPQGQVYLLCDNRQGAQGVVAPQSDLAGRVLLRVAPPERISLF